MTKLSILIQDAIEERIAALAEYSLNLNGDPYGSDSRHRVRAQHWIAYQGSTYPSSPTNLTDPLASPIFERELEYQSYVEVEDLRRDYLVALDLHEQLLGTLANFRPALAEVRSPLRVVNDGIVSAKVEAEVVYRYRATYRIVCYWEAAAILPPGTPTDFTPTELRWGLWRSPIGEVGSEDSRLVNEGVLVQEVQ